MSKQWFYAVGGRQQGPVSTEQLMALLASGQLSPGDLVWTEGMPEWLPAASVPESLVDTPSKPVNVTAAQTDQAVGDPTPLPNLNYYNPGQPGAAAAYAGFWLRFVAYIIDNLMIGFGRFLFSSITAAAFHTPLFRPVRGPWGLLTFQFSGGLVWIIAEWLYFALMESSVHRATLGKMAVGIMVTDLQGNTISFGRATGRYFGKIVSGLILYIGFIMIVFTDRKQGLHDMMVNTLVVRKTLPQH
jgi:uncharacterized RDD family membrane protein YckC